MTRDRRPPLHLRIFIASPGDCPDERAAACAIVDRLPQDPLLRGRVTTESVAWDQPGSRLPLPATLSPQAAIAAGLPRPRDCDLCLVILWSRLGTPLDPAWETRPDGNPYASGTEWEYLDARAGQAALGWPQVLIYRREGFAPIDPRDPARAQEQIAQFQAVDAFCARLRNPDGSWSGAVNAYQDPAAFAARLPDDLRSVIKRLLEQEPDQASPSAAPDAPPGDRIITVAEVRPLERAYLERLARVSRRLERQGGGVSGASGESQARLRLDAVYTALLTRTPRADPQDPDRTPMARRPDESARGERPPLSALELLGLTPRLVLLGEAGSGKSTFLDFVALCLAGERLTRDHGAADLPGLELLTAPLPGDDGEPGETPQPWTQGARLPVLVTLRYFAAECPWPDQLDAPTGGDLLWDYLARTLGAVRSGYAAPLKRHLAGEGGLILLDGLDEVPKGPERRRVQLAIEGFLDQFAACRVVLTSRTYSYRDDDWRPEGFVEAELAHLGAGQVRRFVRCWYAHAAERGVFSAGHATGLGADLERAIFGRAQLRELAERPLLLTLMARLHQRGGGLPDERAELYEESVRLLLEDWEQSRVVLDAAGKVRSCQPSLTEFLNVGSRRIRGLLEDLALAAHARQSAQEGGSADIEARELAAGLAALPGGRPETPPNDRLLIEYLRHRSGILTLAPRDGCYRFPHRSFQEYLAACALAGLRRGEGEIAARVRAAPERWREVALLAAARARATQGFVWRLAAKLCPGPPPAAGLERTAAWCARVAGEVLSESAELADLDPDDAATLGSVRTWLVRLLGDPVFPAAERAAIGRLLARLGDPRPEVMDPDAMDLCWVPPGPFLMGSDSDDDLAFDREKPRRTLDLEPGYWIGRYPVSVAQFRAFVDSQPGLTPGDPRCLRDPDNQPVRYVDWHEALAFCDWLTRRWADRLPKGWRVTLPSEAQWEKAARGGLRLPLGVAPPSKPGDLHGGPPAVALVRDNPAPHRRRPWEQDGPDPECMNSYATEIGGPNVVGCFPAGSSPYGCEEMVGNVFEWTASLWTDGKPYPESAADRAARDALTGTGSRVVRGGSWNSGRRGARAAYRRGDGPHDRVDLIGLRVLCVSPIH